MTHRNDVIRYCGYRDIRADALAQIKIDYPDTPDRTAFDNLLMLVTSKQLSSDCGWSGVAAGADSWVKDLNLRTTVHEIGHNVGMAHACSGNTAIGDASSEYGDTTSVMGRGSANTFNMPHSLFQGWIREAAIGWYNKAHEEPRLYSGNEIAARELANVVDVGTDTWTLRPQEERAASDGTVAAVRVRTCVNDGYYYLATSRTFSKSGSVMVYHCPLQWGEPDLNQNPSQLQSTHCVKTWALTSDPVATSTRGFVPHLCADGTEGCGLAFDVGTSETGGRVQVAVHGRCMQPRGPDIPNGCACAGVALSDGFRESGLFYDGVCKGDSVTAYHKEAGGRNCGEGKVTDTEEGCKAAATHFGMTFAKSVTSPTGRPSGCFWDQNGFAYFNTELDATDVWVGTGGICMGTKDTAGGQSEDQMSYCKMDSHCNAATKLCQAGPSGETTTKAPITSTTKAAVTTTTKATPTTPPVVDCSTLVPDPAGGYIGCYQDNRGRDFTVNKGRLGEDPHQTCRAKCAGYTYFSLQSPPNPECYCGNAYSTDTAYAKVDDAECSPAGHPANSGNGWRNAVHTVNAPMVVPSSCPATTTAAVTTVTTTKATPGTLCDANPCSNGGTCTVITDVSTVDLVELSGSNDNSATNLQPCTGECDTDNQCAFGLTCFQRSNGEPIPGCSGDGGGKAWDYFHDPNAKQTAVAAPLPPYDQRNCPYGDPAWGTCWANSAYRQCTDQQSAYDAVMNGNSGNPEAMYAKYAELLQAGTFGCSGFVPPPTQPPLVNDDAFQCDCQDGWTGETCTSPVSKPCDASPCANGGVCTNAGEAFSCECAKGWTGDGCEVENCPANDQIAAELAAAKITVAAQEAQLQAMQAALQVARSCKAHTQKGRRSFF